MGALPSVHRFYGEDFQESTDEFRRFVGQLNLFTDPMYQLMNQGIEITANTTEEIYILNIPAASATATDNTFLFTPKKFIGAPNGVIIGQALLSASVPTANSGPVTLDWVWTGSQVSILAIHNLTVGSYQITLRIF